MKDGELTDEIQAEMARELGADSLRYLPVASVARAIGLPSAELCQACITGGYPTPRGQELYRIALTNAGRTDCSHRTYEPVPDLAPTP